MRLSRKIYNNENMSHKTTGIQIEIEELIEMIISIDERRLRNNNSKRDSLKSPGILNEVPTPIYEILYMSGQEYEGKKYFIFLLPRDRFTISQLLPYLSRIVIPLLDTAHSLGTDTYNKLKQKLTQIDPGLKTDIDSFEMSLNCPAI